MTKPRVLFAALLLTLFGASAAFAARTASAQEAPSCDLGAYDVNGDAFIGLDDVWVWEHYYEAADARADLNGNGRIQKADVHGIYDLIASPACREAKKVRQPGLGGVKPGQGSFDAGAVTDGLESLVATAVHHGIYVLLLVIPLSGWLYSGATASPANWFGFFTVPDLIGANEAVAKVLRAVHDIAGKLLMLCLALHVLGALKHHFISRDAVLKRMLLPRRS